MQTPAGIECRYFYGDYYRGRDHEECRLLGESDPPQPWQPALCETCPVPEILRANGCEHMVLSAEVVRPFWVGKPEVRVRAYCKKSNRRVDDPHIGCGQCHALPDVFVVKDDE
jgi:hypothetical protein